ncbi:MAG: hypothetical protein HC933_03020 [Pleurocapsa sp. SU_196_0]|nr:hypothetical protein [Pleurocapsa sp. SU_196_0]
MKLYNVLFVLVLVVASLFAFANANTMLRTTSVVIPFAGTQVVQLRLWGTVGFVALAALYSLFWYWSSTRQRAKSADTLTKLEEMRRHLDEREATRFQQLQQQLETQFREVLLRLEPGLAPAPKTSLLSRLTGTSAPAPVTPPSATMVPATLETLVARIEKVRDELAADIAASEHEILQALEVMRDRRRFLRAFAMPDAFKSTRNILELQGYKLVHDHHA